MLQITQKLLTKNFEKGRAQFRPEIIVIHVGEALQNQIWLTFLNEEKSSHYCVDKTGEIWQFVLESDTAYTQGIVDNPVSKYVLAHKGINPNLYSIGIENAGFGNQDFTPEQYQANAELVADICKRWLIPLDSDHIIPHRWINTGKSCPGIVSVDKIIAMAKNLPKEIQLNEIKKQVSLLEKIVALLKRIIFLKSMNNRKYGVFSSSVDPQKLALSIKGLIVFVPSAIALLQLWNVNITENDLTGILLTTSLAISQAGTAVGTAMTLFGLVRKLLVKLDLL